MKKRSCKELQDVIAALMAAKKPLSNKDDTRLQEARFELADEFEHEILAILKGADDTAVFFALDDALLAIIRERWGENDAREFALAMDEFLEQWQFGQAAALVKRKAVHGTTVN